MEQRTPTAGSADAETSDLIRRVARLLADIALNDRPAVAINDEPRGDTEPADADTTVAIAS